MLGDTALRGIAAVVITWACAGLALAAVGLLPLDRWLAEVMWPREARLTPEDVEVAMTAASAEMLGNGITTSVEMYFHPERIAAAVERLAG